MSDETVTNQRPAVIAAVIVAALTAAGLWYFFVFRPAEFADIAAETPLPTPLTSETPTASPVPLSEVASVANEPAPAFSPEAETTFVEPTAPTGPAHAAVAGAFLAMIAGLQGLWRTARTRVLAIWTE